MLILDEAPHWTLTRFERTKRAIKKIRRAERWAWKTASRREQTLADYYRTLLDRIRQIRRSTGRREEIRVDGLLISEPYEDEEDPRGVLIVGPDPVRNKDESHGRYLEPHDDFIAYIDSSRELLVLH